MVVVVSTQFWGPAAGEFGLYIRLARLPQYTLTHTIILSHRGQVMSSGGVQVVRDTADTPRRPPGVGGWFSLPNARPADTPHTVDGAIYNVGGLLYNIGLTEVPGRVSTGGASPNRRSQFF